MQQRLAANVAHAGAFESAQGDAAGLETGHVVEVGCRVYAGALVPVRTIQPDTRIRGHGAVT